MSAVYDVQANGWLDDGTESGVIRTQRKGMVIVPFNGIDSSNALGSSINFYNGLSGVDYSNGSIISISINQGTGNYAQIKFSFRGTILGLLRRPMDNYAYTVRIDGIDYPAGTANPNIIQPTDWVSQNPVNDISRYVEIISNNLTDSFHEGEIIVQGISTGTLNINFLGLALSRDAGYREPLPSIWRLINVSLPTTLTAVNSLSSTSIKAVGKYCFYNSSASAITVTVSYGASAPVFVQSVPAGQTIEWNFATPQAFDATLYQVSASASGVQMTLFGRA